MRILLVNYEYPPLGGGAGNATANTAGEMAALGHEVTVLTSRYRGEPAVESVAGVTIHRVPTLRRRQDRCTPFEMVVFAFSALCIGFGLCRRIRPDGVIAYFGIPCGCVALVFNFFLRIPYIVSLRGGDVPGFQSYDLAFYHKLTAPLIRLVWHRAFAVVANSKGLQNLACSFAPELDVRVIPNGVNTDFFCPRETPSSNKEPVKILFVGRLVYQKGIDVLLEAIARLPEKPDFAIDIVGDGREKKALVEQASSLGITSRIRFLGWCPRKDLSGHYQNADIFVLPSRDEGMANVLLEAMATGLPVIVARTAADKKLIRDGLTGRIVRENDPDALRQAIIDIGTDPEMRGQLGKAARDHLLKNYTWRRTAADYVQLAESALGEAGTSGSTHESRGSS